MGTMTCIISHAADTSSASPRMNTLVITTLVLLLILLTGCAGSVGQGNLALARGDYHGAESIFQEILNRDPENLTVRRRLGMTYFFMGRDKDPNKFSRAVKEFEFIRERRTFQPEEQFYYGLALIGQGKRSAGFEVLAGFSHPTKFRIQQHVRNRAAQLAPHQELSAHTIFSEMKKAWRDGDAADKQEQIDEREDRLHRRVPVPLR